MTTTMPAARDQVIAVSKCADCPFFNRSLVSFLAGMRQGNEHAGDCRCPVSLKQFPALKPPFPVQDRRTLPEWCPLKSGDVTVTVGD